MGVYDLSATAASNTSVNSISAAGSASANLIDDHIRQIYAYFRQMLNDIGGANTVGGTADAITITPSSGAISTVYDGLIIAFEATADNTSGTVTANVGGLGAEPVKKAAAGAEATLSVGDIQDGGIYLLRWRAAWDSAGGAWELMNPNSLTVTTVAAEGTATTNLPQGLAKSWAQLNGSGTIALGDSFNVASVTDSGTGLYDFNFTNNMGNALYCTQVTGFSSRTGCNNSTAVGTTRAATFNSTTAAASDSAITQMTTHGDLA